METVSSAFENENYIGDDINDDAELRRNGFSDEVKEKAKQEAKLNVTDNHNKTVFLNHPSASTVTLSGTNEDSIELQQPLNRHNHYSEQDEPPLTAVTDESSEKIQRIIVSDIQLEEKDEVALSPIDSEVVGTIPFINFEKEIDFDDILRLINPFGRWQKILCLIAPILGAWPFVLLPAFVAIKVPHYCRVPALMNTTWTPEQMRNISIPFKNMNSPPAIGQAYEPCTYYDLPYDELARLSSAEEAYDRRLNIAVNNTNGELSTLACDNGWNYDTDAVQFKSSVQIDFDMVCEREPLLQLSLSVYMIGMLFGVITMGAFSDRFGRRKGALVSGFLVIPVLIAAPLSPSNLIYTITRFLLAFLINGHFICMYVLVMEIVGPEYRAGVGFWQNVPFYIGYSVLAPVAYWLRFSWRWLHAVQSWPLIMLPIFWLLIPESPRWLITQGRYWEARVILEQAARMNGKWPLPLTLGPDLLRRCRRHLARASIKRNWTSPVLQDGASIGVDTVDGNTIPPTSVETQKKNLKQEKRQNHPHRCLKKEPSFLGRATSYGLMSATMCFQLLKTPELRQRTVLSCFLWFSICTVYYGMAFYSVKLDGDIFINFFLMGIVALPAYALSWFVYQRYGRKPPLIAVLLLCGVFCCAIAVIDWMEKFHDWHILVLVCATAGKFFMTGAFGMIYVYSAEIFPTVVRNVGISSNSMMARLGAAFAPYINDISDIVWHPLPMLMYGILSIFTALTTTLLPETHNINLVETIEDVEHDRIQRHRASLKRQITTASADA